MSYLAGLGDRLNKQNEELPIRKIDIDNLIPSENNFYGIRDIEELAESIKESGLLHNLVVRDLKNGKYEILSGERRYRALKLIGAKRVMCQVKDINDVDAEVLLIKANAEQRELTASEKIEAVKRLEELYKKKKANGEEVPKGKLRDVIGKDIGMSGTQVGKYQKIYKKLIEPLKEKLNNGDITVSQAEVLTKLEPEEQQVIDTQISTMVPGAKEEKDILIKGINQPISAPPIIQPHECEDIRETNDWEKISELLKLDEFPRLVVASEEIKAIFRTEQIDCKGNEGTLAIHLSGLNTINIKLSNVLLVEEIPVINIKPEKGTCFKINNSAFLWFKHINK